VLPVQPITNQASGPIRKQGYLPLKILKIVDQLDRSDIADKSGLVYRGPNLTEKG
jgi:hypothetical protein